MVTAHRIYVGTIGEGLWRSVDEGATFTRAADGMFVECHVRALVIHPRQPRMLFLGSEQGLFQSDDGADNWRRIVSPLNGLQVWSILVHPVNPDLMAVGTCPSRIFQSGDGGKTWTKGRASILEECPRIMHTRVTTLKADPAEPQTLWAGVEIDGLYCSRDAGLNWDPVGKGLSSRDIHDLAFVNTGNGATMIAATNNDLNLSNDCGNSWKALNIKEQLPWSYCRSLGQPLGEPATLLLGTGDGPPGSVGAVGRSTDGGKTWRLAGMPGKTNSTMWNFAVHPADPNLIYAASVSGEVYRSIDKGNRWEKLPREFGEIRALAWGP